MKKLTTLLITTILACYPAIADWDDKHFATKSSDSNIFAVIGKGLMGFDNVHFVHLDFNACKEKTKTFEVDSIMVNGKNLRFSAACTGDGEMIFHPTTMAGSRYIIDQFKKSKTVSVGALEVSAKGFTKAYELFKLESTAI